MLRKSASGDDEFAEETRRTGYAEMSSWRWLSSPSPAFPRPDTLTTYNAQEDKKGVDQSKKEREGRKKKLNI